MLCSWLSAKCYHNGKREKKKSWPYGFSMKNCHVSCLSRLWKHWFHQKLLSSYIRTIPYIHRMSRPILICLNKFKWFSIRTIIYCENYLFCIIPLVNWVLKHRQHLNIINAISRHKSFILNSSLMFYTLGVALLLMRHVSFMTYLIFPFPVLYHITS